MIKCLIVIAGVLAVLGSCITSFSIACSIPLIVATVILSAIYVYVIINKTKKSVMYVTVTNLLVILLIYMKRKVLKQGLFGIVNAVITVAGSYFSENYTLYEVSSKGMVHAQNVFLMVTAFELVFILSSATYYRFFASFHVFITGLIIELCLFLGEMPSLLWCILICMYYACTIVYSRYNRKKKSLTGESLRQKILARQAACVAVAVMVIVFIFTDVYKPASHKRHDDFVGVSGRVAKLYEKLSYENLKKMDITELWNDEATRASGGISGGKLGNTDELSFENKTVLKVTVPENPQTFYLKAYIGTEYTGNSWEDMTKTNEAKLKKYLRNGLELSHVYGMSYSLLKIAAENNEQFAERYSGREDVDVTVEIVNDDNRYCYVPYFAMDNEGYGYYDLMPQKQKSAVAAYKVFDYDSDGATFDYNNGVSTLGTVMDEKLYSEYVHEAYCNVENASYRFKNALSEIMQWNKGESLTPYIQYVRTYLSQSADYSLTPGALAKGEDFVDEFLFEKKEGYCTAFASAGTLMFRMMGIPARYVEGYVIQPDDYLEAESEKNNGYVTLNVRDRSAHAWTEIYQDGVGWIPVEVIPGYENDGPENTGEVEETETAENNEAETGSGEKNELSTEKIENVIEQETEKSTEQVTTEHAAEITDKSNTMYLVVAFIIVTLFATGLASAIHRRYIRKVILSDDTKKSLGILEKYVYKVLKSAGFNRKSEYNNEKFATIIAAEYEESAYEEWLSIFAIFDENNYAQKPVTMDDKRKVVIKIRRQIEQIYISGGMMIKLKIKYIWNLM